MSDHMEICVDSQVSFRKNVIGFYAHKGGTGKSTLAFETAYRIANEGNNVVLIDADSQLNTTFRCLKRNSIDVISLITEFLNQGATEQLNMVTDKESEEVDMKSTLLNYLGGTDKMFDHNDLIELRGTGGNLRLLMGTPILHTLEMQVINAIQNGKLMPALGAVPLEFGRLVDSINSHYGGNVRIIVDLSPSASILNQNILLSLGRVVIPCSPDDNSIISVTLLFQYLAGWRVNHPYLSHFVKIQAVVFNKYKCMNVSKRQMSNPCSNLMAQIQLQINKFLGKSENLSFVIDDALPMLTIQNMMRFAEVCSDQNISLEEMTSAHCTNCQTNIDHEKVESCNAELDDLMRRVIEN